MEIITALIIIIVALATAGALGYAGFITIGGLINQEIQHHQYAKAERVRVAQHAEWMNTPEGQSFHRMLYPHGM